jgi:lysozyme
MDLSSAGAAFVRHHEGFVPRYYLDPVGVGTIGNGFTWASSAFRSWWGKKRPGQKFGPGATMTRAEAAEVLIVLMREEYGAAVNRFLGQTVAQHVFDAMASVTFNCGAGTLSDRWAAAAKRGDMAAAADLLKTTRVTAKGRRLAGLVSRRLDEAEMLEQADYTIGRPALDPMADGMLVRRERGEAVRQLQVDLQGAGFYGDGEADGIFGPGTEAAVMEFQRSVGLKDDGYAGPATLAALKGVEPAPPIILPTEPAPLPVIVPPAPGAPLTASQYITIAEAALAGLREHYGA